MSVRKGPTSMRSQVESILLDAVGSGITPGAVCRIARAGSEDVTVAVGNVAGFDGDGAPIVRAAREPVASNTLYDLASVTKVFSTLTILSLAGDGVVDLDESCGRWLPEYRNGPKSRVTLSHLLSHTSGLPSTWWGWHSQVKAGADGAHAHWAPAARATMLGRILGLKLAHPVGEAMDYSCLGYITAMAVAEEAARMPWDRLVNERVLTPLALTDTTFTPDPVRTAPTEYQPQFGRGMVHGVVHDETAFALGGKAANAGLFSTVADLTTFGQAILAGLPGVLRSDLFDRLWEDQLPPALGERAASARAEAGFGQSLGLRIGQTSWMSASGITGRGHTGFTGTSLLVDRESELVVALLMNRVHPSREGTDSMQVRAAIAEVAYRAGGY